MPNVHHTACLCVRNELVTSPTPLVVESVTHDPEATRGASCIAGAPPSRNAKKWRTPRAGVLL